MTERSLRQSVFRWGSIGAACAAIATALAVVQSFPLLLLGMILFGVPLMVVPLIFGVTNTRLDTTAGATRIGFSAGDPGQYEPGRVLPIPNSLQVACWLSGVGVVGLVVVAAAA
ncbi:hypothetical protein [Halobacterium jilantaiense]|uniref:Uncharacterized protein n=1 Tax=Halobacterium jilantaiense TaxID=355548 RepID=A0A1I0QJS4_9EURY|nr:hypothetical protein [Halobacterium jilantaiense]SEW26937.1 hypothetical protein SAMN04487945_2646 [Halobacterium jilantaiense]